MHRNNNQSGTVKFVVNAINTVTAVTLQFIIMDTPSDPVHCTWLNWFSWGAYKCELGWYIRTTQLLYLPVRLSRRGIDFAISAKAIPSLSKLIILALIVGVAVGPGVGVRVGPGT